ncbi:MAG: phosphoribosyltransferase family protein [bacterium]
MNEFYKLKINKNHVMKLPLVTTKDVSFYSFNLMGRQKINNVLAQDLYERIKANHINPTSIITVESKAIGLVEHLAELLNVDRYIIVRKERKAYMDNPISSMSKSITSGKNIYWIDKSDLEYLENNDVIFCDDVISTGGTIEGVNALLEGYNVNVLSYVTAFTEGHDQDRFNGIDIIKIGSFPLPDSRNKGIKHD